MQEGGSEQRERKCGRLDLDANQVNTRILWTRAARRCRDAAHLPQLVSEVLDATAGEWDSGHALNTAADGIDKRRLHRDLIRVDAVSCLLQRRECRRMEASGTSIVRQLRVDGSPKLNAEIIASEVELIVDADIATRQLEFLPGSTVVHGMSKLPQKVFMFLHGLWLTCGPTELQLRAALASIRFLNLLKMCSRNV